MARSCQSTGYYFNPKQQRLALIREGVPLPEGLWIPVADFGLPPWKVEDILPELFPSLGSRKVAFVALLTDFDVCEFEAELQESAGENVAGAKDPVP